MTGEQPEPEVGEDRQQHAEDHREADRGQRPPALPAEVRGVGCLSCIFVYNNVVVRGVMRLVVDQCLS